MKSFAPKPWMVPMPVLIIGTYNEKGEANAMNAAWGGQWDANEIIISMGSHATTENLKRNGEFTVAFATKQTMVASDFVGIVSAKNDPKKMEKTGWTIKKATKVNAPVFTDFPMTLECRIKEKYDESETGYYLVAEIVNILADEKHLFAMIADSEGDDAVVIYCKAERAVKRLPKNRNIKIEPGILSRLTNYFGESCAKVVEKPIEKMY